MEKRSWHVKRIPIVYPVIPNYNRVIRELGEYSVLPNAVKNGMTRILASPQK